MIICEVYTTQMNDWNQELHKSIHYGECKKQICKTLEERNPDKIVIYIKEIVGSDQIDDYLNEVKEKNVWK